MNVLLYSSAFLPSMGGVEITTATLATSLVKSGNTCTVMTETAADGADVFPFEVSRRPSRRERLRLARASDIVHSNGSSVALYPYARLAGRPFVWTHNGYQVSCVDGIGWQDGAPTPMTPWASLRHHRRRHGLAAFAAAAVKLGFRRWVAHRVPMNIAGTGWVARRQPLPRQVVGYTPYPLPSPREAGTGTGKKHDFLFIGRLVEEKGADVLIRAFASLVRQPGHECRVLALGGDGPQRRTLEELAANLGVADRVVFLGTLRGDELEAALCSGRFGVVPSVYEEPMGGVCLQMLAAGMPVIVSERGGMAECAGAAGLTFPNGDADALLVSMKSLLEDEALARRLLEAAPERLALFHEDRLGAEYLRLYGQVLSR